MSEVSTHEQGAEDGSVKKCCMGFWGRELMDNGSAHEWRTRVDGGRRRREATAGGRNKRIYVEQGKKVRQMSEEELVEWMENGGDNAFVVHDGKVVTAETVSRLKDSAMIRLVNRLPGGGRKKKAVPKSMGGEDLSATEESSSSTLSSDQSAWMARVNEVFKGDAVEQMKTIASTGPGGWTEAWARKVMDRGKGGTGVEGRRPLETHVGETIGVLERSELEQTEGVRDPNVVRDKRHQAAGTGEDGLARDLHVGGRGRSRTRGGRRSDESSWN